MKKILIVIALFVSGLASAQTYSTGDKEMNATLVSVNTEAKVNLPDFKNRLAITYGVSLAKVEYCFKAGMTAGDAFMAFEVSSLAKRPIEQVITSYKKNKGKGWGVIAKEMGIKPGSPAFHQLKKNTKAKSGKVKPEKKGGKPEDKGNSGKGKPTETGKPKENGNSGKGNGNSNAKGKGK